jgi:uncharacterized protein YbaR (Trm112 family)
MIDKALLEILVCPENKTPVHPADAATLDALNARIREGAVKNREGQPVTADVTEGLIREDGKYLYRVDDDVPVMLIGEAIPL